MIKLQDKHPMIKNVLSDWNVEPDFATDLVKDEIFRKQHYTQQPFDDIKVFSVDEIRQNNQESWCKDYGQWFSFDQEALDTCN